MTQGATYGLYYYIGLSFSGALCSQCMIHEISLVSAIFTALMAAICKAPKGLSLDKT